MKRLLARLLLSLFTFTIGTAVTAFYFFYSRVPNVENPDLIAENLCYCPESDLVSISQHEMHKEVLDFLEGMARYKGKTKRNTFYIGRVEGSENLSGGIAYVYWREDNSLLFLDLKFIPKIKNYVADEIYEKDRRNLLTDVVATEELVTSRYLISRETADYYVREALNNGEKVIFHKKRKQ